MTILFLVNEAVAIEAKQTTAMLIQAAARRGHRVYVCGVAEIIFHSDGRLRANARVAADTENTEALTRSLAGAPVQPVDLLALDLLFIRTNPARDPGRQPAHSLALQAAAWCKRHDVRVWNDPEGLARASNKLYLLEFPEWVRPATVVAYEAHVIRAFIEETPGSVVLKPLQGTRGNDVFFVSSKDDKNLSQIMQVLLRQGAIMAQAFVPGAEEGDTRVVVLEGKALEIDGRTAAIRRVPGKGEFRSNLHAGGNAEPARISPAMRDVIDAVAPKLHRDGLFLTGIDFVGEAIIEINVYSTGGFRDAERFEGVSFAEKVIQAAAKKIR